MLAVLLIHIALPIDHATEELLDFGGDLTVMSAFAAAFLWGAKWSHERVLLARRNLILWLLERDPGLHLRELPRRLNLSLTPVRYHIDVLARADAVTDHRAGDTNGGSPRGRSRGGAGRRSSRLCESA